MDALDLKENGGRTGTATPSTVDSTTEAKRVSIDLKQPEPAKMMNDGTPAGPPPNPPNSNGPPNRKGPPGGVYSAFSPARRRLTLSIVTIAGFFGPLAAGIYLPALPILQRVFDTSAATINGTVSIFMAVLAVAVSSIPAFTIAWTRKYGNVKF